MFNVIKVGGSILSDLNDLDNAARKIAEYVDSQSCLQLPIVVVSAFKNHTDELMKMSGYFSSETASFVITAGENITAGLFALALEKYGKRAKALAGWQVPIIVKPHNCLDISIDKRKIVHLLENGIVPVITGFQGVDEDFEIQDLGRGGSDLSAIHLANAFNSTCILLKKSGGVCSADPDLVENCFIWSAVGYENLLNLVQSGARIVQRDALLVAKFHSVPIMITNLDFSSHTAVSYDAVEQDGKFWSLISYKQKLRVVGRIALKKYGFDFHDNYYEFNNDASDLKTEALKIYDVCKYL